VALLLCVLLATGACQVRTEVALDVAEDGSGTVMVSVGLDPNAVTQAPDLDTELRLEDLRATGWDVTGPDIEADGFTWVRATKAFGTPAEAGAVLAEVAGDDGPFQDFEVTRERSFARTTYGFDGTVDFSRGLEGFGDEALADALDGEALGESVAAIEERIGSLVDEAFTFRVAVGLPGDVDSNAPTDLSNGAVWEPRLSEGRAISLEASSELVRTRTLVLTGVAVLAGLAAVALAIGVPIVRRRRRRLTRPRGRHGAPTEA
jgi:hypothetical protein